jgi:hypothetical protein
MNLVWPNNSPVRRFTPVPAPQRRHRIRRSARARGGQICSPRRSQVSQAAICTHPTLIGQGARRQAERQPQPRARRTSTGWGVPAHHRRGDRSGIRRRWPRFDGDEMRLANYGVLAGSLVDQRAEGGTDSPHYQIHVHGGEVDFRTAVNVLLQQQSPELLYVADESFRHPLIQSRPTCRPASPRWPASSVGGPARTYARKAPRTCPAASSRPPTLCRSNTRLSGLWGARTRPLVLTCASTRLARIR